MPAWYPAWAREFAELYFAGTTCVFLLHGDVHDLVPPGPGPDGEYGSLPQFLATQLFGSWDVVLRHDLSQALRASAAADADRLRRMTARVSRRIAEPKSLPRDPGPLLALIDQLIQQITVEEDPAKQISLGMIIEYAQYLVPSAELAQMAGAQGTRLVRLLSWAQNP